MTDAPTSQERRGFLCSKLRSAVCAEFFRYAVQGEVVDQRSSESGCTRPGRDDMGPAAKSIHDDEVARAPCHAVVSGDGLKRACWDTWRHWWHGWLGGRLRQHSWRALQVASTSLEMPGQNTAPWARLDILEAPWCAACSVRNT